VGRVKHELNCHPVENPESRHILELRAKQQLEPRKQLKIVESASGILLAGTSEANNRFDGFVKSAAHPNTRREEKAKRLENKTARMPENELLDRINMAFQEFRYWSMRALKARIPQPEAYLRSTLEKVAILHKSGRFANTWSIRPEYEVMVNNEAVAVAEAAPDLGVEGGDADAGDDDDEDIKMEDVNL
jgi:transcription initiation factor TFIIF subunit beta